MKSSALNNKRIILLFIDGVGIGDQNPEYNPCAHSESGIFNSVASPMGGFKVGLDATLGVAGFPQSATGQTAIYTGINSAQLLGRHLFGFPNQPLRNILHTESLFVKLTLAGKKCKFINAFRPVFFTTPEIFKNMRMSATTEMNRGAGLPFSKIDNIRNGRALYHDYTNNVLRRLNFRIPKFTAAEAAEIILDLSTEYDLVLYEYFETDRAGHDRDLNKAIEQIRKVEQLILNIIERISISDTILTVISDHGNIEDLRTKSHTLNPAFCAVWNNGPLTHLKSMQSITDVHHYIMRQLSSDKSA